MNKLFKHISFLCGTVMLTALTSCSSGSDEQTIDLLPVMTSQEGKWSMIDNEGNIVYDNEFEQTPTMAINGFFSVKENNGYTLYKTGGKNPEAVEGCENLRAVGIMADGLVPIVRPNKRIEIVNKNGVTKFELSPIGNAEIDACHECFSDGRLMISTSESKVGYIDKNGENVIPCIYDSGSPFENGHAIVGMRSKRNPSEERYYLIDTSGNELFEIKQNFSVPVMFYGYIRTNDRERYILIDMDGEEHKLSSKVKFLKEMRDDLIIYGDENGNCGLTNLDGDIIIRAKYETLQFALNGDLIAMKESDSHEMLILNTDGEEKQTVDMDDIHVIPGFGYIGVEGNVCTIIDDNFKETSKEEFYFRSDIRYSGTIQSDYVNYELAADGLVNHILDNGTGVKEGKFGQNTETLLTDEVPTYYTYRKDYRFDIANVNTRVSMKGKLLFTDNMATHDFEGGHFRYIWDANSKVGKILLSMECLKGWNLPGHTALVGSMKNKGFTVVKEGMIETGTGYKHNYGLCALMKKGNVIAVVVGLEEDAKILLISKNIYPLAEDIAKNAIFSKYITGQDGTVNQVEASVKASAATSDYDALERLAIEK